MSGSFVRICTLALVTLIVGLSLQTPCAQAAAPQVRAILFFSPTCPHCHTIINEYLPPLFEQYENQLNIIGIDVSSPDGQALYQAAIEHFDISEERIGVPTLVIDNVVLVGSAEIPEQLPGLIEEYLAQGGVDWPDIPDLAAQLPPDTPADMPPDTPTGANTAAGGPPPATDTPTDSGDDVVVATQPELTAAASGSQSPERDEVAAVQQEPTSSPASQQQAEGLIMPDQQPASLSAKLARDPAGNALAIVVLVAMVGVVVYAATTFRTTSTVPGAAWHPAAVPVLSLIGLVVAGYLAYVEMTQTTAVCGPVGDCNTVQQSAYARLFGVLPIGVLGIAGYVAILAAWVVSRRASEPLARFASLALLAMTLFGVLFSIYLTFLEPFVIGATCIWCVTSAIVMTLLFWLSYADGKKALARVTNS